MGERGWTKDVKGRNGVYRTRSVNAHFAMDHGHWYRVQIACDDAVTDTVPPGELYAVYSSYPLSTVSAALALIARAG